MTEPQPADPPIGPNRRPSLLDRVRGWLTKLFPPSRVRPLLICSHQYANGTSAWSACWWNGSRWVARCARCGLVAYCR